MAILGNIRKRTTVLILIIGLALFAFVISGIFTANDSGVKIGSSVAEVNGEDLSIDVFRQKVEQASRRYGSNLSSTQLVNTVYDQEVRNAILNQQFEDLGIAIESDQIVEYVKNSPGYAQIPDFQDENGIFNGAVFKSAIADWKVNDPLRYDAWLQDEKNIMQAAKEQMYFNFIKAGSGATLNEGKFDYNLTNNKVDIQYVRVPYTSIADSTIIVTKKEIEAYVKEHKEDFKQDKARDIRFVFFEEKPSLNDETAVKNGLLALLGDSVEYNASTDKNDTIAGFTNATDMAAFLDRNSDSKYDTIFRAKKDLPAVAADSIMALSKGAIYGPYRDGDSFKTAITNYRSKVFDTKKLILEINKITTAIVDAKNLLEFETLIEKHEATLAKILEVPPIKEKLFSDYFGSIKSLGGWGGDFIMATGNEKTPEYFKSKGFDTILNFKEMLL